MQGASIIVDPYPYRFGFQKPSKVIFRRKGFELSGIVYGLLRIVKPFHVSLSGFSWSPTAREQIPKFGHSRSTPPPKLGPEGNAILRILHLIDRISEISNTSKTSSSLPLDSAPFSRFLESLRPRRYNTISSSRLATFTETS